MVPLQDIDLSTTNGKRMRIMLRRQNNGFFVSLQELITDGAYAGLSSLLNAIATANAEGRSKAVDYLENVLDFRTDIDIVRATTLLYVIGEIGDILMRSRSIEGNVIAIPGSWQLIWVMQMALARIPDDDRDEILISAFQTGQSLGFLCHTVSSLISAKQNPVSHGPSAVLSNIKNESIQSLKQLALCRITERANKGQLLETPELRSVLRNWHDWGGGDEPRQWAERAINDGPTVMRFLAIHLTESSATPVGDRVGRIRHTLHLKSVAEYVDLEKISQILQTYQGETSLTDEGHLIMKTFKRQLQTLNDGKDPDSPFYFEADSES